MLQSNEKMLSVCRSAMQVTSELMNECLCSAERMQKVQAEALNEAIANRAPISKQIGSSRTLDDLMTIQSKAGRVQLEKLMNYWTDLFATASANQTQLVRQVQSKSLEFVDGVSGLIDGESSLGNEPLVNDATRSSCAAGLNATDKAVSLSAAQIEASKNNGGSRHSVEKVKRVAAS